MRKILFILFNVLVFVGFSMPSDSIIDYSLVRYPKNVKKLPKVKASKDANTELTNLVVFIRFADDEEIDKSFAEIDKMFNDTTENALSVYNYFNVMTYGKINYKTIYTNNIQNSTIISYQDPHPRCYFEPYSEENPIGYEPFPVDEICPRETQMIAEVLHYIDSLNLVDDNVNLDGNDDGYIDNISFILKGGVGAWASLLWPHMEFFNQDSANVPYTVTVNGKIPYAYNFEFENSGGYFSANVFAHEMSHSLGLPDLYHYLYYPYVDPVGIWDQMAQNRLQQLSTILKYKFLNLIDEPIQITQDGTYTLNSNSSADHHNCYYIKSAIDSTQWYTFEYRKAGFMENVVSDGLIIGRWVDTMDVTDLYISGNGFFDFYNQAHGYWVFRPNSNCDTINGNLEDAAFSQLLNRTKFGPTTNPSPFLTDGTPETSFEITNITENGETISFDVHFFDVNVSDYDNKVSIYPNPAKQYINIDGNGIKQIEIFDVLSKKILSLQNPDSRINISSFENGIYMLKIYLENSVSIRKFIKE